MRQIVLDTETTGLKPEEGHRIIEIGCVELINRKFTGRSFHHYFNPQRLVDAGALQIHGLSNEFLADKPLFRDLLEELLLFIDGAELIIHNAPFDIGFIEHELRLALSTFKLITRCKVLDTLTMARKMHPGQKNSLDALCKRYAIDNSHREYHGALLDAEILARVYLAMTGGQVSLFADEQQLGTQVANNIQTQIERFNAEDIINIPIIEPTHQELTEHQQYLINILKRNENVWGE